MLVFKHPGPTRVNCTLEEWKSWSKRLEFWPLKASQEAPRTIIIIITTTIMDTTT